VALALVLLVGAGLAIRGFLKLLQVDTGMRPDHLLTFSYVLPEQKYPTLGEIEGFHRRFKARLEALPGVKAVSLSYGMPLQGAPESSFSFEGEPRVGAGHSRMGNVFEVEPGFFETLGIDIVRGRAFTREDLTSGGRKVIVDEELARRYLDPKNPFSKRFAGKPSLGIPPAEIIGIARHITHNGLEGDGQTPSQYYRLWGQMPPALRAARIRAMDVSIRTEGDPAALAATVRQAAAEVDPDQPLIDVKTMAQRVEDAGASRRFSMTLLALFGVLALLISAMGLYAVIGYTVSQRTREIGIRMALGAQPGNVRRMVVGQGLRLTALGLLLGSLGALALSGVMRRFVFAVQATDPLTFGAVVLLLLGVGAVASWVPARRASRVHPMSALREE
jgi:predicted permease